MRWLSTVSIAWLCMMHEWDTVAADPPTPPVAQPTAAIPRPADVAMPKAEQLEASIERGVDFLLATQNDDGSWGNPTRTKALNIYAPVPGAHHAFRAATTSLCVMALIECDDRRERTEKAIDEAERWLLEKLPRVRRGSLDALYNVWAHAYGIQALLGLRQRDGLTKARREALATQVRQQIELLARYESVNGGWGYYDFKHHTKRPASKTTSFTTATGLIALLDAKEAQFVVRPKVIASAAAAIRAQQKPDFSYLYSESYRFYPMASINRPGGSIGRSQACNLALRRWGDERITDQVLIDWLDRIFARNLWLDIGRKRPIPHESHFAVAGYFFYYGHYYASGCLEQLPEDRRPRYRALLAHVLLPIQEKDGSWWDFPLYDYHQPYGTAFALMALQRCRSTKQ